MPDAELQASAVSRLRRRWIQLNRMQPRLKGPRAYWNWAVANYELLAGVSRIRARPIKITFDPTNVCQLRCPLCPTGLEAQDRAHGHADMAMFRQLIDEIGPYVFFIDFFNWGEPLLNTHIEDFVQLAASKHVVCSMSTNLSLPLTDERIHRIVTSGLREMIVSVDGASSETYETYRRRGKFDLVCQNMRRIVQEKRKLGQTYPLLTWQYLVFAFNEHEKDDARRMAAEIGVDRIEFRAPFLDVDRYPLSDSDRKEIAGWKPKERLFQIEANPSATKHHSRCGWHYMSSAINWDGTVAPCCTTFETRDDFGTLGKQGGHSYQEVINNSVFRGVRDRFAGRGKEPVNSICEHCPTPVIMDYHVFLNRQVVLFTAAALMGTVGRFFGGARRRTTDSPRFDAASA